MLQLVGKCYGLPFDYLAFDHQITTAEIKVILSIMCSLAENNVPSNQLIHYRNVVGKVLASFDNATLLAKDGDLEQLFRVIGGLMSGLRWTSLLGYLWNKVQTSLAADCLSVFRMRDDLVETFIRGDDSAIFTNTWQGVSLVKLGYDMLRIKAGRGKFSVQKHGMEFLRIWYAERCYGYSCRAVPGLTQRKPWSSTPWSETSTMEAVYDVGRTLQRRGADGLEAYASIASRWCQLHRIPRAVLRLPRALGGAGVEPWDGETYVKPPMPKLEKASFQPGNQNAYRADRWVARAAELGLGLSTDQAKNMGRQELLDTMAADDVPQIAGPLREKWREQVRKARWRVEKIAPYYRYRPNKYSPAMITADPESVPKYMSMLKEDVPSFGSGLPHARRLDWAKAILRETGGSLRHWLKTDPWWSTWLQRWPRSHLASVIDWALGNLPITVRMIHPALSGVVTRTVAAQLGRPVARDGMQEVTAYAREYEDLTLASPVSRLVYSW
jgi:hypothetical protein